MFSLKIVGSDAFLEMPTSARELYFQLGMYADDDGFVNPRKIMRMIGSSEDDIKVLIGKRFVLPFDNGVVVIKHWLINNLVRKDFYQETMYLEQKKTLEIKANKAYTDNVNNLSPQVRLGKVSIPGALEDELRVVYQEEKDTEQPKREKKNTPEMLAGYEIFDDMPARKTWKLMEIERESMKALLSSYGHEELERRYQIVKKHRGEEWCPLIKSPSSFLQLMPNMENFLKKL